MDNNGHSMVEIMVATAVLSIVSLLGFVVIQTSASSAQLANAKVDVQNNLRDTMAAVTSELREGVSSITTEKTGAPEDLFPASVGPEGEQIVFQVPMAQAGEEGFDYSTPITYWLQNEDANGNGRLDEGEDTNDDGVLTRRLVRTQDGEDRPVAGAQTIDEVTFTLLENRIAGNEELTTVRITLSGSKRYGPGDGKLVSAEMTSNIRLVN